MKLTYVVSVETIADVSFFKDSPYFFTCPSLKKTMGPGISRRIQMPKILPSQPILLVDDNPHDYEATKRTFQQLGLKNPLMYCADGEEALDLLQGRGPMSQVALPPRP